MNLSGRVALVTGAGRGIGRATAIALAQAGADIIVNYVRNSDAAAQVVDKITSLGKRAISIQADVGDPAEVKELFQAADKAFDKLDILVNNAGVGSLKPLDEISIDFWNQILRTNLTGSFLCTQAAADRMIPNNYGRIVNVASIGGVRGIALDPAYTAAKSGLIGFTKSMARYLGAHNITVNTVSPGPIETDLSQQLPEKMRSGVAAASALGRMGEPEEVADVILFFASDNARYVTGQMILVDGGIEMP